MGRPLRSARRCISAMYSRVQDRAARHRLVEQLFARAEIEIPVHCPRSGYDENFPVGMASQVPSMTASVGIGQSLSRSSSASANPLCAVITKVTPGWPCRSYRAHGASALVHEVPHPEDHQRLPAASRALPAPPPRRCWRPGCHEWPEVRSALHLAPVDGRVSRQHPQLLRRWQCLVDPPHQREQLFVERREPAHRLGRVAPHLLHFRESAHVSPAMYRSRIGW